LAATRRIASSANDPKPCVSRRSCSACNSRRGPRGLEGLGKRQWTCRHGGASHDRDRTAARNSLAAGHRRRAEGITRPWPGQDVHAVRLVARIAHARAGGGPKPVLVTVRLCGLIHPADPDPELWTDLTERRPWSAPGLPRTMGSCLV
jgi:hypothetical protein